VHENLTEFDFEYISIIISRPNTAYNVFVQADRDRITQITYPVIGKGYEVYPAAKKSCSRAQNENIMIFHKDCLSK
jgi:hypothetical protein